MRSSVKFKLQDRGHITLQDRLCYCIQQDSGADHTAWTTTIM